MRFCIVEENVLKNYVTLKKEKKNNPKFTRMLLNQLTDINTYLNKNKNISSQNKNNNNDNNDNDNNNITRGRTKTMFSSHKSIKEVKLEDFKILKIIGRGSFGKVSLVEYIPTNEIYAMKSLKKDILIEQEQIENTILEKNILENINYPLLCNLIFCFQTEERIYFIMPFLSGGELFQHLRKFRTFDEPKVKFYSSQIALAIEYLHNKGIIYRDLNPENIFGMAKKLNNNEKAMSFCGTPEYLAPEIIIGEGHDKNADWWSFGILIYEMLCGLPPFYVENLERMYELIKSGPLKFPKRITLSDEAKDIIKKLLERNVKKRLGYNGIKEIKEHPFFKDIDFNLIEQKKIPAPFIPKINDKMDVTYFDEEFTSEDTGMSFIPEKNLDIIKANQDKFKDF